MRQLDGAGNGPATPADKRPGSPSLDEALFGATPVPPSGPPVAPGVVAWSHEYDDNGAWRGESPPPDAAELTDPESEAAAGAPDQETS